MAARWVVLLELYPPITTIRSIGSAMSLSTASWRSWVAEQIVSNVRKWSGNVASPYRFARLRRISRSEEHTSELQSRRDLVCRLLLEKKKNLLMVKKTEFQVAWRHDLGMVSNDTT